MIVLTGESLTMEQMRRLLYKGEAAAANCFTGEGGVGTH